MQEVFRVVINILLHFRVLANDDWEWLNTGGPHELPADHESPISVSAPAKLVSSPGTRAVQGSIDMNPVRFDLVQDGIGLSAKLKVR